MAMQLAAEGEQCWLCGDFYWPTTYEPLCAHCTESDFGITAEQVRRVAGAVLGLPKQVWHRVTLEIETTRKCSSNVAGLALESDSYVLACEWPSGRRQVYARYGQSPADALVKAYRTLKGI